MDAIPQDDVLVDLVLRVASSGGGRSVFHLDGAGTRYVIGRAEAGDPASAGAVDVALTDEVVAPIHCLLLRDGNGGAWCVGQGPEAPATAVDGRPLTDAPPTLRDGSVIELGHTRIEIGLRAHVAHDAITEPMPGTTEDLDDEDGAPIWGTDARLALDDEEDDVAGEEGKAGTEAGREERRDFDLRASPDQALGGIARELVDRGLVDGPRAVSLANSARDKGRTFFRVLVEDPQVTHLDDILAHVAGKLNIPVASNEKWLMDHAAATPWLDFKVAERRGLIPLGSDEAGPRYATVDPFDLMNEDWIARHHDGTPRRHLVSPSLLHSVLQRLKNRTDGEDADGGVLVIDISVEEEQRMMEALDRADVPRIVDLIFQRAHNHRASDIHIEPTEEYLLIRNRVDGILHEELSLPSTMHPEIASRIKIISGMDVAEKRRPQDGRIGLIVNGNPIDVRVSTYPTIYGEKVVMRLLDKNALRPRPDDLGMQKHDLAKLRDKLNAPFGLVMISGPTGSGKTTTLYSCLGSIDKHAKNVLTVEDPVEYRLKGVHQMQVNDRIGLTFASGLRTILRQDPDVIMVGECRDNETAAMAVQASLTGHIVFSTIHTNDAVGVVARMLDMGVDHFRVANALSLAIAQRLVRSVCPHCVHERKGIDIRRSLNDDGVSDERLEGLGIVIEDRDSYAHGRGCDHCHQTGYMGRRAVFEVFEMTNAARNLIMSTRFNAEELRLLAREEGMTTLIKHGLWMIEREQTTHSELIRVLGESY